MELYVVVHEFDGELGVCTLQHMTEEDCAEAGITFLHTYPSAEHLSLVKVSDREIPWREDLEELDVEAGELHEAERIAALLAETEERFEVEASSADVVPNLILLALAALAAIAFATYQKGYWGWSLSVIDLFGATLILMGAFYAFRSYRPG